MRKLLVLASFGFFISGFAQQEILVKLFSSYSIGQSWVTTHGGDYFLVGTDSDLNVIDTIDDLYQEDILRTLLIKKASDQVEVFKGGKSFGTYDEGGILSPSCACPYTGFVLQRALFFYIWGPRTCTGAICGQRLFNKQFFEF